MALIAAFPALATLEPSTGKLVVVLTPVAILARFKSVIRADAQATLEILLSLPP